MSKGSNPFYWMTETLRFGRICAHKYPVAGWTLPTIVSFAAGVAFMEYTNPSGKPIVVKAAPVRTWKHAENNGDPYAAASNQKPKEEKKHTTWQAQYVQDMLDGLKHKTTDQKLDDAFYAMDQIFLGKNNKDI